MEISTNHIPVPTPGVQVPTCLHTFTVTQLCSWESMGTPTFTHTHMCSHMNIRVTLSRMLSALEGAPETSKCHSSSPRPLRKQ